MEPSLVSHADGSVERFLHIPYDQRWERLKSTIIQICIEDDSRIPQLAKRMKEQYSFDARPHQYLYQFKNAVVSTLGKHRLVSSTSDATLHEGGYEKALAKKTLKQHIYQSIRQSKPPSWNAGILLRHNVPYSALLCSLGDSPPQDASSPGTGPPTPQYLTVNNNQGGGSPSSSNNAISPTMQPVQKKESLDRATLFIESRMEELMTRITSEERESIITWLHDFWMYSFMTAKYWGRGPKIWTPSLINLKCPSDEQLDPELCRWTIHYVNNIDYEYPPSSSPEDHEQSEEQFDIEDESTWTEWHRGDDRLEKDNFSTVQTLPMAADLVMKTTLGIAIMSRNLESVWSVLGFSNYEGYPDLVSPILPFHLAAEYLDGGRSCSNSIGINCVDGLGHTVLDTLLVTILRSHSTAPPRVLGDSFIGQSRFYGQEVDPCGRWDADSPCIRHLYASGEQTIPREWKHAFCHTSVQATCHTIAVIFQNTQRPDINVPSGLFTSRCSRHGCKLVVGPLHALVLTAFYLAQFGCPGETLFGMVSCLVCLLVYRADPCATAEVSVSAIFGHDTADDECRHQQVNPAELARQAGPEILDAWTPEARLGWNTLIALLEHDIALRRRKRMYLERKAGSTEDGSDVDVNLTSNKASEEEMCEHKDHKEERYFRMKNIYCGNQQLGRIWATTQAELLTYRRLTAHDSWLSARFRMQDIVDGLKKSDDTYLDRLVDGTRDTEGYSLKDHSRCGFFFDVQNSGCVRREEACNAYYGNLDDFGRTTFVEAKPAYY
ncbi:hypothetical protein GGR52DRAFT_585396 [Hypoxylon sp. FL1284]|nr:hypothetical protein GGR52DRAFT_585396 [Hypoxylon sp. FL1284]